MGLSNTRVIIARRYAARGSVMITEKQVGKAFHLALLLTGNVEAAEPAVSDAIAASVCDLTGDQLLIVTAKHAIQLRDDFLPEAEALSTLPRELQRLFLLSTVCRDCLYRDCSRDSPGKRVLKF